MLPLVVVGILVLSGLGAIAGTESKKEEFISETISFSQPIVREKEDYVSIELAETPSWLPPSYQIGGSPLQGCGRFFPAEHQTLGFFISKFKSFLNLQHKK